MPHIVEMPVHVADLIAAGEVVERPASVVKELVENAIDAGATAIAVELRRGGMGLIRVSDDGCGIAAEELPTAFLRHATSKLRGPEDLGRIGTLGFRGEALPAIASVSRVEIVTRPKGADGGARLRLEGGKAGAVEETGAPEGTTISVSDLFYNTPARLKFMKKDSAETAAVAGLLQHLALSRPEISFRFTKDGVESLHTPGDGKLESAVYAALGREFARTLLGVEGRGGEVAARGFVTRPEAGRGSRSMQTFFVNGRFIKSQLLTAAVEEGYRNQLMKGKFPGCVLFVTLPVTEVDVNVHPAKTVVKFSREKEVFDAVYHTVLRGLDAQCGAAAPSRPAPGPVEQVTLPRQDFYQTMDARSFRERQQTASPPPARPAPQHSPVFYGKSGGTTLAERGTAYRVDPPPARPETADRAKDRSAARETEAERTPPPPPPRQMEQAEQGPRPEERPAASPYREPDRPQPEKPVSQRPFVAAIPQLAPSRVQPMEQQSIKPVTEEPSWRLAGEVLRTYIVCESAEGTVWLIDKHAAHERVNFDRLQNSREPVTRQLLLTPAAVDLGKEDAALLLENADLLERSGFLCEDFGDGTVLVREVPADLDAGEVPAVMEELAENLRRGRSLEERRENVLHTVACKAAIKGGWDSDPAELEVLVRKVQSGEVRYCPHGRPVAVKLTKYEIEKMFGRA